MRNRLRADSLWGLGFRVQGLGVLVEALPVSRNTRLQRTMAGEHHGPWFGAWFDSRGWKGLRVYKEFSWVQVKPSLSPNTAQGRADGWQHAPGCRNVNP